MRHITPKDCTKPPASLAFCNGNPTNQKAKTTYRHWKNIITNGAFPKSDSTVNSRYKQADIKTALEAQYRNKCGYCEQYVERLDIEHYRPKNQYYWLAYSWDNLLLACPTCNQNYKKTQFAIDQSRVSYTGTELTHIHCLATQYNNSEQPLLLHPEFDQPEQYFTYDINGKIASNDRRGQYTIKTCGLDREKLNEQRQKVFDDLIRRFLSDLALDANDQSKQQATVNKLA